MTLSTTLAGIELEHPLMNAAGTVKTLGGVREVARSPSAAVMLGSITINPRGGNSGEVYWSGPDYSLNSLGLPNPGAEYLREHLPEMVQVAHDAGKPLFVSVAGFNPDEFVQLVDLAAEGSADMVELNLGCPNVWNLMGIQHQIASFSPDLMHEILSRVQEKVGKEARVAVKVSPYSDPKLLTSVASVIAQYPVLKAITACNTFPNAFAWNDAMSAGVIDPSKGLSGLGGPAMKPITLGQVIQFRQALPDRVQVVGVGGITTGRDIQEFLAAGASAVQVATAFCNGGESRVFERLLAKLAEGDEVAA